MTKYHISATGEPAVCKARFRPCPLGGEHYASLEAANKAVREDLLVDFYSQPKNRLNPGTMSFDELIDRRENLIEQAEADAIVSVREEKRQSPEWHANRRKNLRRWLEAEQAKNEVASQQLIDDFMGAGLLWVPAKATAERVESALSKLGVGLHDAASTAESNRVISVLRGEVEPTEQDFYTVAATLVSSNSVQTGVQSPGLDHAAVAANLFDELGLSAAVPADVRQRS